MAIERKNNNNNLSKVPDLQNSIAWGQGVWRKAESTSLSPSLLLSLFPSLLPLQCLNLVSGVHLYLCISYFMAVFSRLPLFSVWSLAQTAEG